MLINSADLIGSPEPNGNRGFGRVHLKAGMPFDGRDDMALFVADALKTELAENTTDEYHFEMVSGKELELRVTLAWIDPPVTAESAAQLINDLDLTVVGPDRSTEYKMFSGRVDNSNVIERVIVPADTVSESSGTWTVTVSSSGLIMGTQPYSLVVTGPIDEGSGAKPTH